MSKELGFGILGAGLVAPFHAKSVQAADGARLIAFCDMDKERADGLAAEYGVKAYYSTEEMLADPDIGAVNICLPNHLHHPATVQCAQAGKHVITEKPPAMSLRETDEMIAACRRAGVKSACTVQCRVRTALQAIKGAVDSGRFGNLLHADVYMKWFRSKEYYQYADWRRSRKSGAGVTVQQGFHYIDLLQYLAGPVARVQARMTNLTHPSVRIEDTCLAFIDFKCGAQGVFEASTALWPGTDMRIEINGTNGTAIMIGERIAAWQFRDKRAEDEEIRTYGSSSQATAAGDAADFSYVDHGVVIQDMVDAVRENRDVMIPLESVRPTVEIFLAMYQSAARQQPVDLPVKDDDSIWD